MKTNVQFPLRTFRVHRCLNTLHEPALEHVKYPLVRDPLQERFACIPPPQLRVEEREPGEVQKRVLVLDRTVGISRPDRSAILQEMFRGALLPEEPEGLGLSQDLEKHGERV